ncbi:polynucleotide kinase [Gordonia phage Skog]|uniref:Polynucleotide kinase n=1 Tax=Gordonia phage Skog TaxID=2704033 RepID=A0A6G6XKI7_9CAUD|nr:polynucleotide kinase [Gordonia phage Skog]QIG58280.1 polynucleotide kinase [Gordonia phage Skog]
MSEYDPLAGREIVPKRTGVIVDIDGTLCDVTSIRHYVVVPEGVEKDFDSFHRESVHCPPHQQTLDYIRNAIEDGHDIIFVSARKEKWRTPTELFIGKHMTGLQWFGPFMRANSDARKDIEVKRDIHAHLSTWWDIVGAIDDNPSIIALWEDLGIPVEIVPGWSHEAAAAYTQGDQ